MKSNKPVPSNASSKNKEQESNKKNAGDKKNASTVNTEDASVTNVTRTRHKVGHGLANEGTNVSYDEER